MRKSFLFSKLLSLSLVMTLMMTLVLSSATAPFTSSYAAEKPKSLILATTTSTADSGLLDEILPDFTKKTGIAVKVIAVGSGKAIQLGKDGEADVLLVHSRAAEDKFIADQDGLKRYDVMYNDFVLVGPKGDPAKIKTTKTMSIANAFKAIAQNKSLFISRGDESGTHVKEKTIWKSAAMAPSGAWYREVGKGMGEVLQMADEMEAYTLTDRATYLSMKNKLELVIISEGDKGLRNPYGVIAVNPAKNSAINAAGAQSFIKWLLSKETQGKIGEFGVKKFKQQLFIPNASK